MLAYVFTHWPADPARREAYEAGVAAFHRGLATAGSEGFERSFLYRVQGAYWVGAEVGYEDWYLVEGSYALDPLNEAAVSARLKPAHDTAAHLHVRNPAITRRSFDRQYDPCHRPQREFRKRVWGCSRVRRLPLNPCPDAPPHLARGRAVSAASQ